MHECQNDGAGDKPGRESREALERSPTPRHIHNALGTAPHHRMMSKAFDQDMASAAFIAVGGRGGAGGGHGLSRAPR